MNAYHPWQRKEDLLKFSQDWGYLKKNYATCRYDILIGLFTVCLPFVPSLIKNIFVFGRCYIIKIGLLRCKRWHVNLSKNTCL